LKLEAKGHAKKMLKKSEWETFGLLNVWQQQAAAKSMSDVVANVVQQSKK